MKKYLSCLGLLLLFLPAYMQADEFVDEGTIKWSIGAGITPILGVRTPTRDTLPKNDDINSEIKNGHGFHLNFGLYLLEPLDSENTNFGWFLDYTRTEHDLRNEDYQILFDQFHFESSLQALLIESKHLKLRHSGSLGFGLVFVHYDADLPNLEKFVTGSARLKYLFNFEFYRHFSLQFGGGLFLWGEPGRTQAYGGFLQTSLSFQF